ncbi:MULTISPECIES: hypothetical protein, partial [unclassified Streptomyces]|uniref:hypothetical protein n=1 Tax=unclassified Streptomyces TaxID=2593676 RepID=UPI001C405217
MATPTAWVSDEVRAWDSVPAGWAAAVRPRRAGWARGSVRASEEGAEWEWEWAWGWASASVSGWGAGLSEEAGAAAGAVGA